MFWKRFVVQTEHGTVLRVHGRSLIIVWNCCFDRTLYRRTAVQLLSNHVRTMCKLPSLHPLLDVSLLWVWGTRFRKWNSIRCLAGTKEGSCEERTMRSLMGASSIWFVQWNTWSLAVRNCFCCAQLFAAWKAAQMRQFHLVIRSFIYYLLLVSRWKPRQLNLIWFKMHPWSELAKSKKYIYDETVRLYVKDCQFTQLS